jgi:hypothetical protein
MAASVEERYAVHRTDKLNTAYSFTDGLGGPIDKCAYRPKDKPAGGHML